MTEQKRSEQERDDGCGPTTSLNNGSHVLSEIWLGTGRAWCAMARKVSVETWLRFHLFDFQGIGLRTAVRSRRNCIPHFIATAKGNGSMPCCALSPAIRQTSPRASVGAEYGAARIPAKVMQFVADVRHLGASDDLSEAP